MGSPILLMTLALLGIAFGGYIDPDVLRLLSSSQSNGYYVVSPSHYLPVSVFKQNFLPVQLASVLNQDKTDGYTERDSDNSKQKLPKEEYSDQPRSDDYSSQDSFRPTMSRSRPSNDFQRQQPQQRDSFSPEVYSASPSRNGYDRRQQSDSFSQDAYRPPSSQSGSSMDDDQYDRPQSVPSKDNQYDGPQSDTFSQDRYKSPTSKFAPPREYAQPRYQQTDQYLPPKSGYEEPKTEYGPPKPEYGPPQQSLLLQHPWILKSYIEPTYSFGEIPLYGYADTESSVLEAATSQGY